MHSSTSSSLLKVEPVVAKQDGPSPGFKLATLYWGSDPPASTVRQFDDLLRSLLRKCPDLPESRIGDVIYIVWKNLREAGSQVTLLQAAQGIDGSIPEQAAGLLDCMEVAAAWATLVLNG